MLDQRTVEKLLEVAKDNVKNSIINSEQYKYWTIFVQILCSILEIEEENEL